MTRTVLLVGLGFGLTITGVPGSITYNVAYSFTFGHYGGTAPYKMTLAGTLPSGITFTDNGNGTATLAGTTTQVGTFPVTVTISDGNRSSVSNSYTLAVVANTLTLFGDAPDGFTGTAYSYTYASSGGTGAVAFFVASGSLPPGLTLSSTGILSGTPTTDGTYSWTVGATDSVGNSATPIADGNNITTIVNFRITYLGDQRTTFAGDNRSTY